MHIWEENGLKITIKNEKELDLMREGGKILGFILRELEKAVEPGISSLELDHRAEKLMQKFQVIPAFKGYRGFPNVICANVNDEVVHGIPNNRPLKNGDIITIDCGVIHGGFNTDSAITVAVGKVPEKTQKFISTAYRALDKAIETAKPGVAIRTISGVIQDIIEKNGYQVVRQLCGHGIGPAMHEDPDVPNFRDSVAGPKLQPGMAIAIEPIFTMGSNKIKTLSDDWTIVTRDKSLAIQVEHTIAITESGAEILTLRPIE